MNNYINSKAAFQGVAEADSIDFASVFMQRKDDNRELKFPVIVFYINRHISF